MSGAMLEAEGDLVFFEKNRKGEKYKGLYVIKDIWSKVNKYHACVILAN